MKPEVGMLVMIKPEIMWIFSKSLHQYIKANPVQIVEVKEKPNDFSVDYRLVIDVNGTPQCLTVPHGLEHLYYRTTSWQEKLE